MSNLKYQETLAAMQEEWSMSQGQYNQQFGGQKIPEAVYEARLQNAKMSLSKSSGNLMISREHLITKGEHKGKVVYDYMTLGSAKNLVYIRRWFEMMNYQCPENPEEIEATVLAIASEAPDVKIRVTHDAGGYTNADVTELIGTNASSSGEESQGQSEQTQQSAKEYTVDDLKIFCTEKGMDISACGDDGDAIMREIRLYTIEKNQLTDDQYTMLIELGLDSIVTLGAAEVSPVAPPVQPTEDPKITKLKEFMVKFCIGQDIPYENDDNYEQLKERIDAFAYPIEKLTAEEVQLLKDIGLEEDIQKTVAPTPDPSVKKAVGVSKAAPAVKSEPTPAPAAKKVTPPVTKTAVNKVAPAAAKKSEPAPAAKKAPPLKKK
jgi:hypothetical protein